VIESFKNVYVVLNGDTKVENKFREYDYCMPLCGQGFNIELGVWYGRSINYLAKNNPNKHFYGFDTFEGVDAVWDCGTYKVDMKKSFSVPEQYLDTQTRLPRVLKNVTLIKGLFEETLQKWKKTVLKDNQLSFINIDSDIYSIAKFSLDTFNENIRPNTIIRFDELADWIYLDFPGYETKNTSSHKFFTTHEQSEYGALLDWIKENNRQVEPLWRTWFASGGVRVIK